MSRGARAELARYQVRYPLWWIRRIEGGYVATMGNTVVAAETLPGLGDLLDRAAPPADDEG